MPMPSLRLRKYHNSRLCAYSSILMYSVTFENGSNGNSQEKGIAVYSSIKRVERKIGLKMHVKELIVVVY